MERQVSNSDLSRSPSPYISSGDFTAEMRIKTERLDTVEAENIKLKLSLENLQKSERESKKLVRMSLLVNYVATTCNGKEPVSILVKPLSIAS